MTWISIPEKWTGKQALAVVEFLDEISAMIWAKHEIKMLNAYHKHYVPDEPPEDEEQTPPDAFYVGTQNPSNHDDDFPF